MENYIRNEIEDIKENQDRFFTENVPVISDMAQMIKTCFLSGGKVYVFGVGGSGSIAQYISSRFLNRYGMERPELPVISLNTDSTVLTYIARDYGMNEIFVKQLNALGQPGDVAWGISGTGYSDIINQALRTAGKLEMKTIGFSGHDGGSMKGLCDILLGTKTEQAPRVKELHMIAANMICGLVDELMFGGLSI